MRPLDQYRRVVVGVIATAALVVLGTGVSLAQPVPGAAKDMSSTNTGLPATITITYTFENLAGTGDIMAASAVEDLAAVFGVQGVDWTFTSISSVPPAFANPGFDGNAQTQLINQAPTQSLAPGMSATVTVQIMLLTVANVDANGFFCNQVTLTGQDATGAPLAGDLSTDGLDPDPNGDGNPDEEVPSCLHLDELPVDLESFTVE